MSQTFTMQVANNSGDQLENVLIIHCCNENISPIYLGTLGPQVKSDPVDCTTYDSHNDYYLIQFVRNGNVWQANCYCNADSGSAWVVVELSPNAYNILYNDTNCTNKSYDYATTT